ncbi:MAG TPA: hypothetical protein VKH40_02430, partial [Alloacidobacterium sp.]|nr:hypothetical protein [Alloacidobacterium sp.]
MSGRNAEKHAKRIHKPQPKIKLEGPAAVISRRAADRIRAGHVWVYQSDVEQIIGEPSGLLPVADQRGILLGTALYSPTSQIALRLISSDPLSHEQWLNLLRARVQSAIRMRLPILSAETNACRLVFSEADALPGIIADKYGDLIILQLLTKGLDSDEIRTLATDVLRSELSPRSIIERPDPRIRELEQLSAPSPAPLYAANAEAPFLSTDFRLNGLTFHYDAGAGQKTGAFLDQRGILLGTALYSPTSQIALRLISSDPLSHEQWLNLLRTRLQSAIRMRLPMLGAQPNSQTNACRLVFSEADALPGIIADKYGDLIILQLLTKGFDSDEIRTLATDVLRSELSPRSIIERPDPRIRELEQLSAPSPAPLYAANAE